MARRALKNTIGLEDISGTQVRRQIVAGDMIPPHWSVEDESAVEEVADAPSITSYGSPPAQSTTTPDEGSGDGSEEPLEGQALQDKARELKIEGRSAMNADELREAVAKAEAGTGE